MEWRIPACAKASAGKARAQLRRENESGCLENESHEANQGRAAFSPQP
jgi:hypothetical protein